MIPTFPAPSPEQVARIRAMADRSLPVDEFRARAEREIPPEEREEIAALVRWFTRRYPTVKDRLDYARRAAARWRRVMPPGPDGAR